MDVLLPQLLDDEYYCCVLGQLSEDSAAQRLLVRRADREGSGRC